MIHPHGKCHCRDQGDRRVALCGTSEYEEFHLTMELFTDLMGKESKISELCEKCMAHPDVLLALLGHLP